MTVIVSSASYSDRMSFFNQFIVQIQIGAVFAGHHDVSKVSIIFVGLDGLNRQILYPFEDGFNEFFGGNALLGIHFRTVDPFQFVGNIRPVIANSFPILIFSRFKKIAEMSPYHYNTKTRGGFLKFLKTPRAWLLPGVSGVGGWSEATQLNEQIVANRLFGSIISLGGFYGFVITTTESSWQLSSGGPQACSHSDACGAGLNFRNSACRHRWVRSRTSFLSLRITATGFISRLQLGQISGKTSKTLARQAAQELAFFCSIALPLDEMTPDEWFGRVMQTLSRASVRLLKKQLAEVDGKNTEQSRQAATAGEQAVVPDPT